MRLDARRFTPPCIRWNLVADAQTCAQVKEAIGPSSTTPCSEIVHRFSHNEDWIRGFHVLNDKLEQRLDMDIGRLECIIVLRTNPAEPTGIPADQNQWEQTDILKASKRALIIDFNPVWFGVVPSGRKQIETIGILRADHLVSIIIPIIRHYLEQVELQVMLSVVRNDILCTGHSLALAMAHKSRAQDDEWVLAAGQTLDWTCITAHQIFLRLNG